MPRKPPAAQPKAKMDGSTLLRFLLGFETYWRLMALLLILGILAGTVAYVFARPTYRSTAVVQMYSYVNTASVASNPFGNSGMTSGRELGGLLTSPYYILQAGKRLKLATDRTTYNSFRDEVVPKVRIGHMGGNVLLITVETFSPTAAREFGRALIETYTEEKRNRRIEFREKALGRYADELKLMRERVLGQLDTQLKYEEESALASAQIELERLSDIPVQLVRTKYRLQEMERISQVLKDQGATLGTIGQLSLLTTMAIDKSDKLSSGRLVRGSQTPPVGAGGPVRFQAPGSEGTVTQVVIQPDMVEGLAPWKDLEKKKRNLEERERLNRSKYLTDHPEMKRLREELKEVEAALELELDIARKTFDLERVRVEQELADLEGKLPDYYTATKSFDQKRLGYDLMQRGQLAWASAYEKLAKQLELMDTEESPDSLQLELRSFTEMRDQIPVSPGKSQTATMGLLLGLALAFGVPVLLRRLDTSVSDLNEFESTLGIPGIGLIPLSDPDVLNDINRSPSIGARVPNALLENFRLIRSSILLNPSPKGEPRTIMFTSARPGEGKTTTACNVGWAFASQGDRTIVVDCDLRRGRVHAVTGLTNHPGLTDLLTGKASLEDCVQKSPAENLWVITRGPVVAGTTELLNTDVFSKILDQLRGQFDRVILDTPPVLGLSETAFLQNHAEGVVLVVRSEKTPRKDVMDAFVVMEKLGAHFYGFVLNRVDFAKRANLYYYYYYSSNYYDSNWEESEMDGPQPARGKMLKG